MDFAGQHGSIQLKSKSLTDRTTSRVVFPMSMQSYFDGLREAYEGEIEGETVYRSLSELSENLDQRHKLATIADVEQRTHRILEAVASRLGIEPAMERIAANAVRRTKELYQLPWPEFIVKATVDWPPYIERFEALGRMAPEVDALPVRRLMEHERALVAFVRLEHERSRESLWPLQDFLARTRGEAVR